MKKRMVRPTLALSMMTEGLTTCGSADSGITGVSAAPTSSTASTAKEVGSQGITWSEGPVQIIAGADAGGGTDTAARLIGKYMKKYMGQSFVVTDTTGGAGGITTNDAENAKASDYTFLVAHEAIPTNKIAGTTDFDCDAFARAGTPFQVYTTCLPGKKYASVPELADAAKASPGTIRFGTELTINGTAIITMMEGNFGISFQLVDAGTVSDQIASMMGDHIDFMKAFMRLAKGHVASGDFHTLTFFNQERNSDYPDMPTMKEEGTDFVADKLFGCFFPKNTDPVTIEKSSSALEQIRQDPDFQKEAADMTYRMDYITLTDMPVYPKNCKTRLVEHQNPLEEHHSK